MVEYKELKKCNAFVDRRFGGAALQESPIASCCFWLKCPRSVQALRVIACTLAEDDATLTEEDKAIARFQKQRMKDLKG